MRQKRAALAQLGRKRQAECYKGYRNIGEFHDGAYDGSFVSPYTLGAGNIESPVMLVLQDWCSEDFLEMPFRANVARLGRDPKLPTNRNLEWLLDEAFDGSLADVYATNLFPFIKPGGMSSTIATADLQRAGREFAVPQIEIVGPRLVICLGAPVFQTLHRLLTGAPFAGRIASAIEQPADVHVAGRPVRLWAQVHPGGLGMAQRGKTQVRSDWLTLAKWLKEEAGFPLARE